MRVSLTGVVRSFGAHTVLDRVDLTLGPRSRLGLVGPNGAGKSTLLRLARRARRAGRGHGRAHARVADGRLPAAGARPPGRARRCAPTSPDAPASRTPRRPSSGTRADWSPDAYAAALERFLALGGADLEPRARSGLRRARPAGLARPGDDDALRRPGRPRRRSRRSCSPASTCSCSTSRPTTSTSTGSSGWSASSTASPAASPSSRTTAPSSTARSAASPRSTPGPAACASTRAAGATSRRRASARARSSTPPSRTSQERRREVEALLHARRNQARAGGGFLAHATGGSDRRGTHALAGKVRQAQRALERVEHVEKPYEPWQLHLSLAAAQRPGDRVASLEGAVGERGDFRLGPVDLDLAPGERVAVTGPQRQRQVDPARAAARRAAARRRTRASSAATTVLGALDQRRVAYDGPEPLLWPPSRARTGLPPARPARCSRSSTSAPTTSSGRARRSHRASARARTWPS